MSKTAGYTGTAKVLHWFILALLIAQFIFAWTMPHIGGNTPATLISLHFTIGICILAVAIARLVAARSMRVCFDFHLCALPMLLVAALWPAFLKPNVVCPPANLLVDLLLLRHSWASLLR